MEIFKPVVLGNIAIKNKVIRTATFEGMADENGFPTEAYESLYMNLAGNNIGAIITGFSYISKNGKAMQPGQAAMDNFDKIPAYRKITDKVHQFNCKIIIQLAHPGRQTNRKYTDGRVVGISSKKSFYFNEKPDVLNSDELENIINDYANAALFARESGFDGVQIHAAHGYLIHQSILPSINNRKDAYGIDGSKGIGTLLLDKIIDRVRDKCGQAYPILVKVSGSDDYTNKFKEYQFVNLIKFLDSKKITGIEISYGTMDYPLNIFRGSSIPYDTILKYNPRYKQNNRTIRFIWKIFIAPALSLKLKPFTPLYNLPYAILAKKHTSVPIISVGGFRSGKEIETAIRNGKTDFVSLCRPFICEPDFAIKIQKDPNYQSRCINCNICAVMCDSIYPTKCYYGKCP
jgi:2,4-dienoyl-CoA reductase-like NADH-dependent reductase (Old Yellow Enzyme family)